MTVIVAAIVGFLTARLLWLAMRKSWNRQPLMRKNYQGVTLPTAAGIVLALTLVVVEGARQLLSGLGLGELPGLTPIRAAGLVAVLSFTIFGLLDDLIGTTSSRGFMGHARALGRGELTSGAVKAIGGAGASLIAAGLLSQAMGLGHNLIALLLNAAIIALSANFFNLLDLRPGRTTKVGLATFVVIALIAKFDTALVPTAIVVGAAVALVLDDLHERLMMGDTGANALGAAIGLGLAAQLDSSGRWIAFGVLLALNLLSEVVSYTKLIDNFAPLRALDNIGRRKPAGIDVRDKSEGMGDSGPLETPPFEAHQYQSQRPVPPWESDTFAPSDSSSAAERDNLGDAQDGDDQLDLREHERGRYSGYEFGHDPHKGSNRI